MTLVAEQPYWQGEPVTRQFLADPPRAFFSPSGSGTVLGISSSQTLTGATFTNTGDVDALPHLAHRRAFTAVTVGVAGRVIEVPFALADGQSVVHRPSTAGADRLRPGRGGADWLARATDFAPIPPGASVPLSLTMSGTGAVTATMTPQYFRAY